ncbi:hypothetical protein BT96DRAFT_953546 [Gymnopus androsaceus JB14]|uniref:Lethal giant larvae (Lgl)-like C-terminal domain-containing protein n=1 Tax=Gymnopus androsaceus JB14 TaxID=1447944 RepID=A0A6A4IKW8_9AGAR|nr:hypothetical protein BT96DRAFT_953546 [Gymnopus androsaceus JB14]
MFSKQRHDLLDLSIDLHEAHDWKPAILRRFEYPSKVTALSYEPIAGLLAVGSPGNIELLGKPGVECKLTLPDPHEVKILHISASTFKLLCLDDHDRIHIWDLSTYGQPKLLTSTRFDQANSVTISPSHSHAFIALQTGEVRTYDIECLRKSAYSMPSMWKLYQDKMALSGMPEIETPTSGIALDTVVHPRDLNLLFVTERSTVRTYELVFPPGAPGGTGYGSDDILTHRRPEATCMAIHPAGHFFAVGYADGSLAFWAVEDEDQPLLVRTLDDIDIHTVDAEQLEAHLAQASKSELGREPIFKLSWCSFPNSSDSRGGETALVILGGLGPRDSPGITVHWLPAFNPTDPPVTQPSTLALHPFIRSSMRSSVEPLDSYFYEASGTIVLHFAGSYDPTSIIIVRETTAGTRVVEAYQFPPPSLVHVHPDPETASGEEQDTLDNLATTLQDLQMSNEPHRLKLPSYLSNSSRGLLAGSILTVTKDAYATLIQTQDDHVLPLKAGFAWLDRVENTSKYHPPRISITWYADLSVQLWDVSAQLLQKFKPDPLDCDFPSPLPNLIIDTNTVLTAASNPYIQFVEMASESLECAIVFSTGMVVIYRLIPPSANPTPREELPDAELLSLKHLSPPMDSRFSPYFALLPDKGQVSACSLADVGFLAVAYVDGSLYVVDMRGPNIILRHGKSKSRHSMVIGMGSETDVATCLRWTICPTETDKRLALRLIVGRSSGASQVFTFGRSADSSWVPFGEVVKFDSPVQPMAMFVLNSKNGSPCGAYRSRLAASMDASRATPTDQVLLVIAGSKGARCNVDITGDRLGKVEWNNKMGKVSSVQIVQKLGSCALVAFTENHEVCTYSLPNLEYMHTLALPSPSYLPITVDQTGDFFVWARDAKTGLIRQAAYGTLFNFRRIESPPAVDFLSSKPVVPSQPQPVSVGPASILGSWFKFGQSMTGAQVDTLLGGPDRPVPIQQSRPNPAVAEDPRDPSQVAEQAAATQSSLYNRLTAALEERGQMLGDLEDRFNSLESGSRSMVDQAKKLAAEQSAKSWFKFGS